MAEPPSLEQSSDHTTDSSQDQTQPTAEILQHLQQLATPTITEQPPRVPTPSEFDSLFAQLQEKPHDPDGWKRLIELVGSSGEYDKIRAAFEALLKHYPNTSSAQIMYIKHFLNDPEYFNEAEELFKRFLKDSRSVDLFKFYLTYVRRVNTTPATRDNIRQCYDFALNRVGYAKDSGEIWSDYIQFLKAGETTTTWEEQQKMDFLRKVYHRAVQIPLDNVERLWQELETFENTLNKITAKKFMADLSPAHMQARTALRQMANLVQGLYPPSQPSGQQNPELYLPALPTFNASERTLVGKWKAYLKWEESNPLELEEKDKATLISRIQGVYRKAVVRMRFYSEIWFMAYTWTNSVGKTEEAISILKAGIEANPASYLLTFAYAEVLEGKKEFEEVHAVYERLIALLHEELDVIEARTNSANSSFSSNNEASNTTGLPTNGTTPTAETGTASNNSSFNTQGSEEKPAKSSELTERRTEFGLAWIQYARFARRAEGVKSSRMLFAKARRDRWLPWEAYEAQALMEYHCSDDKSVSSRIFQRGMEVFADEIEFVLRYLGFLISINDETNARALFERVIPTFPPERARPLWERWARYEYQYGDLEGALKLEKRIAEAYPSDPPIKRFAQRHIYLGTDAIASRDLGFAMARKAPSTGLARTETQQSIPSVSTPLSSNKRPPSPDHRKGRDDSRGGAGTGDYSHGHKRMRAMTPPPRGERESRWEGPPRRRYSPPPPSWDRDRERAPLPPPRSGGGGSSMDKEDEKRGPTLPQVISWFVGELPAASQFDGPIFRTDDLMNLFRNAVIPSTGRAKSPPPPPPPSRGAGRPPPDYSPYQGPGSGRTGRRY